MDCFTPGPRELTRKIARFRMRRQLRALREKLAKAETDLGLLGWQQADYDAETERQVRAIYDVERDQSELANKAAALGLEIRRLTDLRTAAMREHESRRKEMDANLKRIEEPLDALEKQLEEKRKVEPNFVRNIPELDRELREVQKAYSELLVQSPQTLEMRNELIRLRERIVAIPNEKSDLRVQHLRTVSEIRRLEEELARQTPAIREMKSRIEELEADWKRKAREFDEHIQRHTTSKVEVERSIDDLERAKTNPYQLIGEALANSGVAPMNQPQALDAVKQLRGAVTAQERALSASLAETRSEESKALHYSYALWGGFALLVLVFMAYATHR